MSLSPFQAQRESAGRRPTFLTVVAQFTLHRPIWIGWRTQANNGSARTPEDAPNTDYRLLCKRPCHARMAHPISRGSLVP